MDADKRTILLATDADTVFKEVDAALSDSRTQVLRVTAGADVLPAIREISPDLVILDLQIGNMGGVATCLAIRNEEGANRVHPQNVLLLLDRIADVFIAKSSEADGWIVKPLNPLRLQRAARLVMDGEYYTEHLIEPGSDHEPDDEPDQLAGESDEGDESTDTAAVASSDEAAIEGASGDTPAGAEAVN